MFRKSLVIAFLSVFAALPVFANPCDNPPREWKSIEIWGSIQTLKRACHNQYVYFMPEEFTPFQREGVVPNNSFSYEVTHSNYPLRIYFGECEDYDSSLIVETPIPRKSVVFKGLTVPDDSNFYDYYYGGGIGYRFRIQPSSRQYPDAEDRAIYCDLDDDDEDDDDECPDLNLTIRGTLLPARRGTARVSGDWCN